jgi:hypothetical protein
MLCCWKDSGKAELGSRTIILALTMRRRRKKMRRRKKGGGGGKGRGGTHRAGGKRL